MFNGKLLNRRADAFTARFKFLKRNVIHQEQELLASVAEHIIKGSARPPSHATRQGRQNLITFGMAIAIIELFEVIHIKHHQPNRRSRTGRLLPGLVAVHLEGPAIANLAEGISHRKFIQRFARHHQTTQQGSHGVPQGLDFTRTMD